jgi:dipeptidyl-peptidase-4
VYNFVFILIGVKYLSTLPYIDTNNIGFWGWSGGGYMSCMLSTRASEYFKAVWK